MLLLSNAVRMFVQSMEIDNQGRMWIIDNGNTPEITVVPSGVLRLCPPRLVIVDIATTAVIRSYTFDDAVANRTTSFLNDIVLDTTRGLAYISNTGGDGSLIVYSFSTNSARAFSGASTKSQPFASSVVINGLNYSFPVPVNAIALSADTDTLYYGALGGYTMFAVPTAMLSNFSASVASIDASVTAAFNRTSANGALTQTDGMATSAQGSFFYGSHGNAYEDSVVQRMPDGTVVQLYNNSQTMQWVDTFGWGGPGQLIFTSNRLQQFFAGTLSSTQTNFRLFSVAVPGQTSYLQAQVSPQTSQIQTTAAIPTTSIPAPSPTSAPPEPLPAPANSNAGSDSSGLSPGAIAGTVIGSVVGNNVTGSLCSYARSCLIF